MSEVSHKTFSDHQNKYDDLKIKYLDKNKYTEE